MKVAALASAFWLSRKALKPPIASALMDCMEPLRSIMHTISVFIRSPQESVECVYLSPHKFACDGEYYVGG